MVDRLHPALQAVLQADGWTGLTQAQQAAWQPLRDGQHALVVAPTGHGKTEAALLPVLDRLLRERDALGGPWPTGFKVLYITPLRALNRDLQQRLAGWCEALELRLGVRHGDTSQAERARQARDPPDLLVTTPETVQLLLYGDRLRAHLRTVRFVIIDEAHVLAGSERGAQLAVALERIEEAIAQPDSLRDVPAAQRLGPDRLAARPAGMFQRIGLSATVADPPAVARLLAGTGRDVTVVDADAHKERRIQVLGVEADDEDHALAARFVLPVQVVGLVRAVRAIVAAHRRVLVFCNTRDLAEMLCHRSAMIDEEAGRPPLLGLHHGSLSLEHRIEVEAAFKQGDVQGLVATSSLELGIDIGAIDHVIQVGSPRSVSRLVQRLGRAGHRVGAVSEGTLLANGPEEHLECLAIAAMAQSGDLEPLRLREAPLVVLANQIVALSNEYRDLRRAWCRGLLQRAAPFGELDEGLFEQVWETLLDLGTVRAGEGGIGRSGRSRRHFLEHISLIPDQRKYRVLDEAAKRTIGTVDEAAIAAGLGAGADFVMAGRSWRVLEVDPEARRLRVAPAKELSGVPQWTGSPLPVSLHVARATAKLRQDAADGDLDGPAAHPIQQQQAQGLAVPTDRRITLESGRRTVVVHVPLGTRGNDALGRFTAALVSQRIGTPLQVDHDAYRIRFVGDVRAADILHAWRGLDPDSLDILLAMVLKDQPVVRHQLVQVAKEFGALPKAMDPTRITRAKLDDLWDRLAMQEETLARLVHERFDLPAVADWLRDLDGLEFVEQALGPISRLGDEQARRMVAPPMGDRRLLKEVRRRIEASDVLLACTSCGHTTSMQVAQVPRRVRCRRCAAIDIACLRPWHEEQARLLTRKDRLTDEEAKLRKTMRRNGALMAGYGAVAARALAARGVGPTTAARLLQKCDDPEAATFWRELLQAELDFARTSAAWH